MALPFLDRLTGAQRKPRRLVSAASSRARTAARGVPKRAKRIVDLRRVVRKKETSFSAPVIHRSTSPVTEQRLTRKRRFPFFGNRFARPRARKTETGSGLRSRLRRTLYSSRVRLAFLTIVLAAVVGGLAYAVFLSPFFRVERVVLHSAVAVPDAQLHAAIAPVLSRQFFGLPGDNIFLVPERDLETALIQSDPRVAAVHVTKKYPTILAFDVTERHIAAVWLSGRQAYFLDDAGVACCEASLDALLAQDLPRLVDLSLHPVEVGKETTLPRNIQYATQLSDVFRRSLPMQIARFELPSAKAEEIHIVTSEGVQILFSLSRPVDVQMEKLQRVLREEIKDRYSSLQYIDLRVEGYAYYK